MERIFIVDDITRLGCTAVAEKLNVWLENGWSVKSVTSGSTRESVTFVFVLEKEGEL